MVAMSESRKKVIVVDDVSRSQITFIEDILAKGNFEVAAVVRNVEEAIRLQDNLYPDVVTMRLSMPYIDGCRMLKPMEGRSQPVKVVITAKTEASPAMRMRLTDLGADVVLDKSAVERDPSSFCAGLGALTSFAMANGRKNGPARSHLISSQDIFPIPEDEDIRLQTLAALRLKNLDPNSGLDKIVHHLARQTGYPIVAVSIIGAEEVWIKASNVMERCVTPREHSICAHAICHDKPWQIPDTFADHAISMMPCVKDGPHIRSYVGAPIMMANGVSVGVICVADTKPRLASRAEIVFLKEAADLAAEFMQREKVFLPNKSRLRHH